MARQNGIVNEATGVRVGLFGAELCGRKQGRHSSGGLESVNVFIGQEGAVIDGCQTQLASLWDDLGGA